MLTCDLVEMALWCEVAWIKLGDANLSGGRHTLQIRPLPLVKEEKQQQAGADGKPQEVVVPYWINPDSYAVRMGGIREPCTQFTPPVNSPCVVRSATSAAWIPGYTSSFSARGMPGRE